MRQIIDKHYDNDDFKFVFSEGSNSTVLVDVQTLGDADTSLTGYTAKIYYYDHVDDTTFYEIDSDSSTCNQRTLPSREPTPQRS
jgi:hypothetical protein